MTKPKLICLLCAAALALVLAGCGGSASSAASSESAASSAASSASQSAAPSTAEETNSAGLDAAFDALLAVNPISNPFELAALNIEYDFGLAPELVTAYKGVKSNDNGDAGLVLVIQPAAGKAQEIADALETYQADQAAFYANYAEFDAAKANVENAVLSVQEDQVVLVIASLEADAAALPAAVEDALA